MDEATVIAQIVANTQVGIMFDTEVDKDVPIDPDDYEIANAIPRRLGTGKTRWSTTSLLSHCTRRGRFSCPTRESRGPG